MTAAFDAERGTGTFTDALSGSDGTGDPSVLMPVLDVYPDALSAPMPVDLVPVIVPPTPRPPGPDGVRANPVTGPAARRAPSAPARTPAAARGQRPGRPAAAGIVDQQGRPLRPGPARPNSAAPPVRQAAARPAASPLTSQGRTMTAADFGALFRTMRSGQSEQLDRISFQATHPQSRGSNAPSAVQPAAPMASQYSQRGQTRSTARDQAAERRRTNSMAPGNNNRSKRGSSTWAVIVFLIVIAFSTGLGQRVIDAINELLNR